MIAPPSPAATGTEDLFEEFAEGAGRMADRVPDVLMMMFRLLSGMHEARWP